MKFIEKVEPVDAVQWDGTNVSEIFEILEDNLVGVVVNNMPISVILYSMRENIRIGDWAIRESNGELSILDNYSFNEWYSPVKPNDHD